MANKLLLALTATFIKEYEEAAREVGVLTLASQRQIKKQLNKRLKTMIEPVINNMFREGQIASNKIVSAEVASLANDYKLPLKYNKDLLATYNTKYSVYTGYFDTDYKQLYTKREIDALKRTILRAKYSNFTEAETIRAIRNTTGMTAQRARLVARNETARLDSAAKSIYYENTRVKEEFDLVWVAQSGARPEHVQMDGQVADEEGFFTTPQGTKTKGAPQPDSPFNCRCKTVLRHKKS